MENEIQSDQKMNLKLVTSKRISGWIGFQHHGISVTCLFL